MFCFSSHQSKYRTVAIVYFHFFFFPKCYKSKTKTLARTTVPSRFDSRGTYATLLLTHNTFRSKNSWRAAVKRRRPRFRKAVPRQSPTPSKKKKSACFFLAFPSRHQQRNLHTDTVIIFPLRRPPMFVCADFYSRRFSLEKKVHSQGPPRLSLLALPCAVFPLSLLHTHSCHRTEGRSLTRQKKFLLSSAKISKEKKTFLLRICGTRRSDFRFRTRSLWVNREN